MRLLYKMLLLPPLQRVDWDRVEQYMLHEEFESTTKVTRQEDKPKPGTGRDQDQGPEPGEKKPHILLQGQKNCKYSKQAVVAQIRTNLEQQNPGRARNG